MSEIIPSPKELFGSRTGLTERSGLQQSLSDYILHIARVVINNPELEDEVLFSQRDKTKEWHLPGGKVDKGQTCAEAAICEARQEVGLDIFLEEDTGAIYGMCILGENGAREHVGKLMVSTVFTVENFQGSPKPLDETEAVAWKPPTLSAMSQLGTVRADTYPALSTTGHLRTT